MYIRGGIGVIKNFLLLFLYLFVAFFFKFNCLQSISLLFAQNTGLKLENTGLNKINKLEAYFKQSHGLICVSFFQFNQNILTLHLDLFLLWKIAIKVTFKSFIACSGSWSSYLLFISIGKLSLMLSERLCKGIFNDLQFCLTCLNKQYLPFYGLIYSMDVPFWKQSVGFLLTSFSACWQTTFKRKAGQHCDANLCSKNYDWKCSRLTQITYTNYTSSEVNWIMKIYLDWDVLWCFHCLIILAENMQYKLRFNKSTARLVRFYRIKIEISKNTLKLFLFTF